MKYDEILIGIKESLTHTVTQTDLEKFSNLITILSFAVVLIVISNKSLWTKILNK